MSPLEALRGGYGLFQLAFPKTLARLVAGRPPDPRAVVVIRILGARHLLQALVLGTARAPRRLHLVGAMVDTLHALSMVALAAVDQRRRRLAGADALLAGSLAGAEWHTAKKPEERR